MIAKAADVTVDQTLVAEISPAMIRKLQSDWRLSKAAFGMFFMLAGIHLTGQNEPSFGLNETWLTIFGFLCLLFSVIWFCLAFFGPRLAVKEEVAYRRQHGKWRWEH
jgi:hypothetical protein